MFQFKYFGIIILPDLLINNNYNLSKMKKFIKIMLLSTILVLSSCEEEDKLPFERVTNAAGTAGGLRTIEVVSNTFNFLDLNNSSFSVEVEEWDAQSGGLLESVEVYAMFNDFSEANGDSSVSEMLVSTIPASDFTINGKSNLPRSVISVTANEVINALGLDPDTEIRDSDAFRINLVLKLTTGAEFSSDNLEGNLTGVFFNSPFTYPVQFSCPLEDASLFQGTYFVVQDDWADYAVGDEVPVELGDAGLTFRILNTNNPFVANPTSSYMEVTINPEDGSVTLLSNECFDYGPGFCLDVTGVGSVGSCTGDINLVVDFGAFADNVFKLTKNP
jgi:hypothetical protein